MIKGLDMTENQNIITIKNAEGDPDTTAKNNFSPKVSIVVPIYGVEKYLHQCVDSILAQTLKDIEIILVDDGSKDKCPEIVDEYAKKDSRIVAVHQPNGGYGRAVNHGIELAKGEYIGIIESDDWIEPTMYEKLYQKAIETNADITKSNFYVYNSLLPRDKQNTPWYSKRQDLSKAPDSPFNVEEYPQIIIFHASIWSNLYKANFIKKQKFVETASASYQDFPFMIEAMCRANKICVVKEPLVHYRMEEGQNSSTIRRDARLMIMADQALECKKILKKYNKYKSLKEEFYLHAYSACSGFYQLIYLKHKREFLNKLQELFKDLDLNSLKKGYFSKREKQMIAYWQKGNLLRSIINSKSIRRFLLSIHINKQSFLIQFLGIQLSKNAPSKPALVKFTF